MFLSWEFFGNLAFATLVLCSDCTVTKRTLQHVPWPHVFLAAVQLELADETDLIRLRADSSRTSPLDDSERLYIIDQLKLRRIDLAEAPPLADQFRWPRAREAEAFIKLAKAYEERLRVAEAKGTPAERKQIATARVETQRVIGIWKDVLEAVEPDTRVVNRRLALLRLRTKMGTDAYYKGELPLIPRRDGSGGAPLTNTWEERTWLERWALHIPRRMCSTLQRIRATGSAFHRGS